MIFNLSLLNISIISLGDLILIWYLFKHKDRCDELEKKINKLERRKIK